MSRGTGRRDARVGISLERGEVVGRRQRHAASKRVGLEQAPEPIDLLEVVEIELGDDIAPSRPVGDETLAGEGMQRLAGGDEAHARSLGPDLLVDAIAGAELTLEDRRAHRGGGERLSGRSRRSRRRAQRNALSPVSAWPTTSVCTSWVPS